MKNKIFISVYQALPNFGSENHIGFYIIQGPMQILIYHLLQLNDLPWSLRLAFCNCPRSCDVISLDFVKIYNFFSNKLKKFTEAV